MNTLCGDTVMCRLDAGKRPIFRSQSPCTDISVRKSEVVNQPLCSVLSHNPNVLRLSLPSSFILK